MKSTLTALFLTMCVSLTQGCKPGGSPITVLGTPRFVPQSQPDSVLEAGVGQDPGNGRLFVQWYNTAGAAGYKLYRSDSTNTSQVPIDFSVIANQVSTPPFNDSSFVDVTAGVGTTYYYYLVVYSAEGGQSQPSDTINYRLLHRPGLISPAANAQVNPSGLYFNWHDVTSGGFTVIRVKDITNIPQVVIWVSRRFSAYDAYPSRIFNFDSLATSNLIPGHIYEWRVDRFNVDGSGRPYQGARSVWTTFTVN